MSDNIEQQEKINDYLNENIIFTRDWFVKNATNDFILEWFNYRRLNSDNNNDDDDELNSNNNNNNNNRWLIKNLSLLSKQLTSSLSLSLEVKTKNDDEHNSITEELLNDLLDKDFHNSSIKNRITTSEKREKLLGLSEDQLLVELIVDIMNELNVNLLCHKILTNVSILINCDRSSLFLAKGNRDNRYLVAKLFDVTPDSQLKDALVMLDNKKQRQVIPPIPFGTGIVGHVAKTKQSVNIKNVYQDSRFHRDIDIKTGYHTKSLICQPILNSHGDVIGVAECINKLSNDSCFTENDEKIFQKYLIFCGFSIQNAQLFQLSILEYKRYQLLLNIAKVIFEDTTDLDLMIKKIINKTKQLLDIDKCRIYIIKLNKKYHQNNHHHHYNHNNDNDHHLNKMFDEIFESNNNESMRIELDESDVPLYYAQKAAINRKTLNSEDISSLEPVVDNNLSILSVPIFNNKNKLLGIAQLIKNESKVFTEAETGVIEAFSIFCGLGLQSCLLYDDQIKLNAKQQIALEIFAYHASINEEEVNLFMNNKIPSINDDNNLDNLCFDDITMNDDETVAAFIRICMELNFLNNFNISFKVLCRWILTVRKNYRRVIYHNWRHALNVTQTMFFMIKKCNLNEILNEKEQLALIVASICHDLDHRGLNNSFQAKTSHPLTKIYSTSYMENHHFNCTMLILNLEGNNIFENIAIDDRNEIINIIEQCILSTDLAEYIWKNKKFVNQIHSKTDINFDEWKNNDLLRAMLMTASDLSAICKPWTIQKRISNLVANEFYQQGDLEQTLLHLDPIPIMDRKKKSYLPKGQVEFIDNICLPLYKILYEFWPQLKPLLDGCLDNRKRWQELIDDNNQ